MKRVINNSYGLKFVKSSNTEEEGLRSSSSNDYDVIEDYINQECYKDKIIIDGFLQMWEKRR